MAQHLCTILDTLERFLTHCRAHLPPADYTRLRQRLQQGDRLTAPWSGPDLVRHHLRQMASWERVDLLRRVLPLKERRQLAETGKGKP